MPDLVMYHGDGEWSALYVDGKLERVGDSYLVDERIRELCGVKDVYSDDFLRGGDTRADVAPTLTALEKYTNERETREEQAAELRARASELRRQADELEGKKT